MEYVVSYFHVPKVEYIQIQIEMGMDYLDGVNPKTGKS